MIKLAKSAVTYLKVRLRKTLNEELWLEDYKRLGMRIGEHCSIQPGVVFDYSHCWLIRIGNHVTIAPEAYLLAHDASTKRFHGYSKIGSVTVEDYAFIGARALIMPGVTIGSHSIVAAGSVVTRSVPPGSVVAGNPARIVSATDTYMEKTGRMLETGRKFSRKYTIQGHLTDTEKESMYQELVNGIAFVE